MFINGNWSNVKANFRKWIYGFTVIALILGMESLRKCFTDFLVSVLIKIFRGWMNDGCIIA